MSQPSHHQRPPTHTRCAGVSVQDKEPKCVQLLCHPPDYAIATLALCYNNPSVFTGVVKIRKGQAVDLIMQSTNMESVEAIFAHYAEEITAKINVNDYSAKETSDIVSKVQRLCPHGNKPSSLQQHGASLVGVVTVAAVLYAYWNGYLNDV